MGFPSIARNWHLSTGRRMSLHADCMRRVVASFAIASFGLVLATDCNVFERLEDCKQNSDCRLGHRCNTTRDFCEKETGPLTIGAVLPIEGFASSLGKDLKTSLDLATSIVNASGGVLGRPLAFRILGDRPDDLLDANLRVLVDEDRAPAILGGTNSNVALRMQAKASPLRVLSISPMATSPVLSTNEPATDRYFFRTMGITRRGEALAQALYTSGFPAGPRLCQRTMIVDSDSAFSRGYRTAYEEAFKKLGGCIGPTTIVPDAVQSQYIEEAAKIIANAPDCLLLVLFADSGAAFIRYLRGALQKDTSRDWSKMRWLGASPFHLEAFMTAGLEDPSRPESHIANGMVLSDADTNPPSPEYFRFRARYNEFFKRPAQEDTPPNTANAFDAAILIALAIERAGTIEDRTAVRDGFWKVVGRTPEHFVRGPEEIEVLLRDIRLRRQNPTKSCGQGANATPCEVRYKGASSELRFDPLGTVQVPSAIYTVVNGKFVLEKRYDEASYDAFEAAPPQPASCP
jgi:ABC-type branched-subunit amino acid transport system substrate-binding protein